MRSLQNSLARRTAMTAGKRQELHALEENWPSSATVNLRNCWKRNVCAKKLQNTCQIERVPFIDTFDLRTELREAAQSLRQAVMFCLMDVSGSIDKIH
ncbi:DUF444 family protein [Shigella boydii]